MDAKGKLDTRHTPTVINRDKKGRYRKTLSIVSYNGDLSENFIFDMIYNIEYEDRMKSDYGTLSLIVKGEVERTINFAPKVSDFEYTEEEALEAQAAWKSAQQRQKSNDKAGINDGDDLQLKALKVLLPENNVD